MTIQHWEWALFVLGQSHYFIGRVHIVLTQALQVNTERQTDGQRNRGNRKGGREHPS